MFMIGALPALLALVVRRNLKEPEVWVEQQRLNAQSGEKRDFSRSTKRFLLIHSGVSMHYLV